MTLPTLESLTPGLDRSCVDVLGDAISYKPAGGSFGTIRAHVDYGEAERGFDASRVIEQEITVEVLMFDVPTEPTRDVRLTFPKIAGKTYAPANVRRNESGTAWVFEVSEAFA